MKDLGAQKEVDIPLQSNPYDCGVFVCAQVYCLCHGLPINTFRQSDMTHFRAHMTESILKGKLHNMINYPELPSY